MTNCLSSNTCSLPVMISLSKFMTSVYGCINKCLNLFTTQYCKYKLSLDTFILMFHSLKSYWTIAIATN